MQKYLWWLGICALISGCRTEAKAEPSATRISKAVCSEDCTPYACDESGGTCFTSCRNDEFCSAGFLCNWERQVCEAPQPPPGDCSVYMPDPDGGCRLWCARESDCTSIAYCDFDT